jgi:hypothetical protein
LSQHPLQASMLCPHDPSPFPNSVYSPSDIHLYFHSFHICIDSSLVNQKENIEKCFADRAKAINEVRFWCDIVICDNESQIWFGVKGGTEYTTREDGWRGTSIEREKLERFPLT